MFNKLYWTLKIFRSLNYGSLGFVIAHEMTHAFDQIGNSQFNFLVSCNLFLNEQNPLYWMKETLICYGSSTLKRVMLREELRNGFKKLF